MKKAYFVLIACLLCSTIQLQAKKISGSIVYHDKIVDVIFKIPLNLLDQTPQYQRIQWLIRYIDQDGKTMRLIPSKNIKEIQFNHLGQKVRMITCINSIRQNFLINNSHIFLKLEIEGAMNLYSFYDTSSNGDGISSVTRYDVAQRKDKGDLKLFRLLIGRKKDILSYFYDCDQIKEGIKNKSLSTRSIWALVELYNKKCG